MSFPLSELITGLFNATRRIRVLLQDSDGEDFLTETKPGHFKLTGSKAENHESLTVSDTATGFVYAGAAIYAIITLEDAQVRFWTDGTSPTADNGHILDPGDVLELDSNEDINNFKAITTGDINAVLRITFKEVA